MSVTVEDCLALPSLRDATVAGGAGGLNKIVASVTVLEWANVSMLSEDLFAGNEMALTAFVTARDDVDLQCEVVRHLYNMGVVAIVLYYLGSIVPKLDKKLIAVADELSLPLITMPPKNFKYRYAHVIMEVVEAILYENLHEKYFVPTIIERVAQFPESQRNLDNVLRILSDRFHITIFITDEQMRLISKAIWPVTGIFDSEQMLSSIEKKMTNFQSGKVTEIEIGDSLVSAYYSAVFVSGNQKMYVFAVKNEEDQSQKDLDKNTLIQISESIQLIVSMRNYSDWSLSSNQLVNAIMNKDAYRTTQIAMKSGIDIKAVHDMWIIIVPHTDEKTRGELQTTNRMLQVKEFLSYRYKSAFVGSYEDSIICLMSEPQDSDVMESVSDEFLNEVYIDENMLLLSFADIQILKDVRKAYDASQEGWFAIKAIYKSRSVFSGQELSFALSCLNIIHQEGNQVKEKTAILDPLSAGGNAAESIETLSVFLLDAGNNITETAKLMHVHPNTVKYRLKEIKKKLKADLVRLPDSYKLYLAVALKRLYSAL